MNAYWLLEEATPKALDDKLQQIINFGDNQYSHTRLSILKDEPDEIIEEEINDKIEKTTRCYAVRTLVQADFSDEQIQILQQLGFIRLGFYQYGQAQNSVLVRMKADEAKWQPDKPNRPQPHEKKERREKPDKKIITKGAKGNA